MHCPPPVVNPWMALLPPLLRRHKVVRDLEWVWTSPGVFSPRAAAARPPGLPDSTCAGVAASAECQHWLAALDREPAPLVAFLVEEHGHDSSTALGFYFAQLLEFWLRFCPGLGAQSLQINRPIKVGAQTVGQLKYLFQRPAFPGQCGPDRLHHWESSVKYFLRAAPSHVAAAVGAAAARLSPADAAGPLADPAGAARQDGLSASGSMVRRAAGGADPAALEALIEGWSGGDLDRAVDGSGKSPLHQAAWRGDPHNVVLLLERGAGVENISTGEFSYGKTALFFAITRSRDEVVSLLLEHGASARVVNNKGQTPLSLGASHLQPETLRKLAAHEEAEVRDASFSFCRQFLSKNDYLSRQAQDRPIGMAGNEREFPLGGSVAQLPSEPFRWASLRRSRCVFFLRLSQACLGKKHLFESERCCTPKELRFSADPRFMAAGPSDVVTPLCVNPTTRLSRKGNFERNNPVVSLPRQAPDATQLPAPSPPPPLSALPSPSAAAAGASSIDGSATVSIDEAAVADCSSSTLSQAIQQGATVEREKEKEGKEEGEEEAGSGAEMCLGLYVGPSLHENLAWRVAEAQRKMELAAPGGAGYAWLAQTGAKHAFFCAFSTTNDPSTKTGSGQTLGKHSKRDTRFSQQASSSQPPRHRRPSRSRSRSRGQGQGQGQQGKGWR